MTPSPDTLGAVERREAVAKIVERWIYHTAHNGTLHLIYGITDEVLSALSGAQRSELSTTAPDDQINSLREGLAEAQSVVQDLLNAWPVDSVPEAHLLVRAGRVIGPKLKAREDFFAESAKNEEGVS